MQPVLSREEVTALLEGLAAGEPDRKIWAPGPAGERVDSPQTENRPSGSAGSRGPAPVTKFRRGLKSLGQRQKP
jgi:hypothetical protein